MERRVGIIAISLFLVALFLVTVGSDYTGYSVLDQSQLTFSQYPFPFVKNNVPNEVYIVMPYDYTYNEFKAAQDIAVSIQGKNPVGPAIVTDKDVPEGEHNLILIGNACNNDLISQELATTSCDTGLQAGQASLTLVNHQRTSTLVVSAYNNADLEKAAVVISNFNFYPLTKTNIIVNGELGNLVLNYF